MVINAQEFLEAIEAIELNKGISREVVLASLKEAMEKGYRKELGDTQNELEIEVIIEPEKGIIEMYCAKDIVDEVEDDFLQVSLEDAKAFQKEGQGEIRGDKFYFFAPIESLKKATANSIKSILKQKFAEAEKSVLYEAFKDKINTMITGKVEKVDERGCSVNIGRTSVYLQRNQMIGDEKFALGDDIRLFVENVSGDSKGARIVVSRASAGFLKALFFEEIREIYDGTIIIKSIAREAGERSKVSVFTNDPNVDPAGACIGQNGNRIQKIVSQLGNGQAKEKIDIIAYSDNPGLYVMEALKPARVVGVKVGEDNKSATVVVKDDSLSLAIGKKGVNVRLAVRLTGINIDIKTESDALAEEFEFVSFEELQAQEIEANNRRIEEARLAAASTHAGEVLQGVPEGYVAPLQRQYEDESNDFDETLRNRVEEEEFVPASTKVEKPAPAVEEPAPAVEEVAPAPAEEEIKEVKTTTTLEDLERTLESGSNKQGGKKQSGKKGKKKAEEEETSAPVSAKQDPSTFMSIYTEEELAEMEEEDEVEEEYDDEDVDYDEYDEYYDDDDK